MQRLGGKYSDPCLSVLLRILPTEGGIIGGGGGCPTLGQFSGRSFRTGPSTLCQLYRCRVLLVLFAPAAAHYTGAFTNAQAGSRRGRPCRCAFFRLGLVYGVGVCGSLACRLLKYCSFRSCPWVRLGLRLILSEYFPDILFLLLFFVEDLVLSTLLDA
jgi:hypothetical protein